MAKNLDSEKSGKAGKAAKSKVIPPLTIVKGTRRLVREKAMQLLSAQEVSEVHWRENFAHIFNTEFRLEEAATPNRLLTEEEIHNLEADFPIEWDDEMRRFALELLIKTEENAEYALTLIEKFSQNWEVGRLASIDRVVLKIAIAELICFPEIPAKVTINEAIEIVKRYSTDKSGMFVNGILDSAFVELKNAGKAHKTGRGLLDVNIGKNNEE
ncbi:MAG: transcription antitermination factor NusB [Candidatus Kapaibacterium sp.]|nr:MAG: transcription antitermination factor NusB [Candidatus Kapabacteria bacterium]